MRQIGNVYLRNLTKNELTNIFFFAFVTAARMSFVLIFVEGHQGNEKQSLTSSQNQNPLLIHVSIACEQQTHFWLSLLSRKCVCLSCRHKMLSAI